MPDMIAGRFPNRRSAEQASVELRTAGFERQHMRLLPPSEVPVGTEAILPTRRNLISSVVGAIVVAAVGALIAWLAVAFVPALSNYQGVAALVGALAGAAIGWGLGAVISAGNHVEAGEYRREAAEYGAGPALLSVETPGSVEEAGRIMMRYGARLQPAGQEGLDGHGAGPDVTGGAPA